jgi:hypothetical protein
MLLDLVLGRRDLGQARGFGPLLTRWFCASWAAFSRAYALTGAQREAHHGARPGASHNGAWSQLTGRKAPSAGLNALMSVTSPCSSWRQYS